MNNTLYRIEELLKSMVKKEKSDKVVKNEAEYNASDDGDTVSLDCKFAIDELVVIKATEKQTHVTKITSDGKYECHSSGGTNYDGTFDEDQLFSWDEYLLFLKGNK